MFWFDLHFVDKLQGHPTASQALAQCWTAQRSGSDFSSKRASSWLYHSNSKLRGNLKKRLHELTGFARVNCIFCPYDDWCTSCSLLTNSTLEERGHFNVSFHSDRLQRKTERWQQTLWKRTQAHSCSPFCEFSLSSTLTRKQNVFLPFDLSLPLGLFVDIQCSQLWRDFMPHPCCSRKRPRNPSERPFACISQPCESRISSSS